MFDFQCIDDSEARINTWTGKVRRLVNYGTHYELQIESRSSLLVLFGKTSQGGFACIPDFGVGCHLASPKDKFWNTERLIQVLGIVDGITVASALYAISDNIKF
jgi:hypothetical protein